MGSSADTPAGYTLQYLNDFGGIVYLHNNHNKNERDANLIIAVYLADRWRTAIYLLPVSGEPNAQNPDALLRGEYWEFKTNYAATGTSIDTEIKRAAKQATNIVIHLTKSMAVDDLANALFGRVRQCKQVEQLAVIFNGSLYLFDRATIMSQAFRRQLKKEKGA